MKRYLIPFLMLLFISCNNQNDAKKYIVKNIPKADIKLDGILDEGEWQKANLTNHFVFPWENTKPPKTEFRAFHDADYFYYSFIAEDDEIVIDTVINNDENLIEGEDRVEIYLSLDDELKEYYCLEVDVKGRVLSYSSSFHRQFDFSWECPEIKTGTAIIDNGYVVEVRIPLSSLESLGFPVREANAVIMAGLFRAQFNRLPDGEIEWHWLSWIDPNIKEEDFHVRSSFGHLIFEK